MPVPRYQALPKSAALLTTGAGARAPPPIHAVERLPAESTTWCKFRTCSRAGGSGWRAA